MNTILYGSLTVSLLHLLIPSHWLPFVTIGQAERWSLRQTLSVTAIAGLAHTTSTTLLGGLVGLAGWQLAEMDHTLSERVIPLLLLALGLWYLTQQLRHRQAHRHVEVDRARRTRSFTALLLSLGVAMFLSPCLEINAYFLSAGTVGLGAVVQVALLYNVVTLSGMLLMVTLGRRGLSRINPQWLAHNEHGITGLTLIGLALLSFFHPI